MSVLVIGGDHLGAIPAKLQAAGYTSITHVSGRKRNHCMLDIPQQIDCIIVLIDYVSHALMANIKERTRESGKRTIFARRAWSHIEKALSASKA